MAPDSDIADLMARLRVLTGSAYILEMCLIKVLYGYAESSSSSLITTKRTKDTKGEWPIILSFLRDLRVLRGEIIYDRIQLELFRSLPKFYKSRLVF